MPTPMFFKAVKPAAKPRKEQPKPPPRDDKAAPKQKESGNQNNNGGDDLDHFSGLLALLSSHKAGGEFGAHNVKVGHHVAFSAGRFQGAGKVTAVGQDGPTVEDGAKREHRIHWREITGHHAKPKDGKGTDV